MPTVYRTMWEDNGLPRIGTGNNCLGVRVPPTEPADVRPDANGIVSPGRGMSVFSHWNKLPPALIPEHVHPRGRGPTGLRCFRMGSGPFESCAMNSTLELRVGRKRKHGEIGPIQPVTIENFQADLAATQNQWQIDEAE